MNLYYFNIGMAKRNNHNYLYFSTKLKVFHILNKIIKNNITDKNV